MQTRKLSKKYLILALMFSFFSSSSLASECYHYHTIKSYRLVKVADQLYLEAITKDPNRISIAGYYKMALKSISSLEAKIYIESQDGIIIKNKVGYFYISKSNLTGKELLIDKIVDNKSITTPPIGLTFFINGIWKRLEYNAYYPTIAERVKFKVVKDLLGQAKVIRKLSYGDRSIFLVGNEQSISSYDESDGTINLLATLNSKALKIDTLDASADEYAFYDANRFYLTRDAFKTVVNLTSKFKQLGLKASFSNMKIIKSDNSIYLDFKDGNLWPYVSAGISLQGGGEANFFPVEKVKYIADAELFLHKGMLYDDPWSLINERDPIGFSLLKTLDGLSKMVTEQYSQQGRTYRVESIDSKRLFVQVKNPSELLQHNAVPTYNNAIWTYLHPTSSFFATSNSINYYNFETHKNDKTINFKTPLKDLKLAYAFDDKLLIENEVINSIADYNTIQFLGSTVEVVRGCDGGRGQVEIVVNYNYYFKDKKAVYSYHTGDKSLKKLEGKVPSTFNENNFIANFWDTNKSQ